MATDARSIASLTISFGLVAIPVKLYSATISSERISFNLLHQKDGSRLKQQYVCAAEGKVLRVQPGGVFIVALERANRVYRDFVLSLAA